LRLGDVCSGECLDRAAIDYSPAARWAEPAVIERREELSTDSSKNDERVPSTTFWEHRTKSDANSIAVQQTTRDVHLSNHDRSGTSVLQLPVVPATTFGIGERLICFASPREFTSRTPGIDRIDDERGASSRYSNSNAATGHVTPCRPQHTRRTVGSRVVEASAARRSLPTLGRRRTMSNTQGVCRCHLLRSNADTSSGIDSWQYFG
jgi:hypothetical protein